MSSSNRHLSFFLFEVMGCSVPGYEKVLGKLSDRIIVGVRGADLQAGPYETWWDPPLKSTVVFPMVTMPPSMRLKMEVKEKHMFLSTILCGSFYDSPCFHCFRSPFFSWSKLPWRPSLRHGSCIPLFSVRCALLRNVFYLEPTWSWLMWPGAEVMGQALTGW